jgi:hypothetical protein
MDRNYPAGAVHYLRRHPLFGNMFNLDKWGGYLIWALPERKVFIDGRNDIFEYSGVLLDYYRFSTLQSRPEEFFGRYNLKVALFQRGNVLQTYFEALPGWTEAYCDSDSVVFVRSAVCQKLEGAESRSQTKCP